MSHQRANPGRVRAKPLITGLAARGRFPLHPAPQDLRGREPQRSAKILTEAATPGERPLPWRSRAFGESVNFHCKVRLSASAVCRVARSRRGYSAPWCGYSCGGAVPEFPANPLPRVGQDRRCGMAQPVRCDLPHPRARGMRDKYGIGRRHAAPTTARQRLVYTEVYTDIKNSGHLGPSASE